MNMFKSMSPTHIFELVLHINILSDFDLQIEYSHSLYLNLRQFYILLCQM